MMVRLRSFALSVALLPGLASLAQTQLLPDLGAARGGGILNTCDTSLHVGFSTTIENYYSCSFAPEVQAGSTNVGSMIWSYYANGVFGQETASTLHLTYPGQQPYPVCLTVDAYDMQAMQPCSTTVCDIVTPLPHVSCVSLQAAFGIASVNGNTITFQDNSVFDGLIQQTIWSFGDGASITASTPSHEFIGAGPFEVCLTVVGPAPAYCTSTLCQYLYIGPGAVECPTLVDQGFFLVQADNLVGVLDTSTTSGMNSHIDWDFGDGALAQGNVAVHAYSTPGEFQVCGTLRVWGPLLADTCISSICRSVSAMPVLVTEELTGHAELQVGPNPFSTTLSVSGPARLHGPISILDATGRTVAYYPASTALPITLDLHDLRAGPYLLRIDTDAGTAIKRVVKE